MLPIISCEHASNKIPKNLACLFYGQKEILTSHKGYDLGAQRLAAHLAGALQAPLHLAPFSRLVADCNRSIGNPALFSVFTWVLPPLEREAILALHYHPYRQAVLQSVQKAVQQSGSCLHISVHSFTPVLRGKERRAEIGLLYDPARLPERKLCRSLLRNLKEKFPRLRSRCNYPYRGVSDGLTTVLRKSFAQEKYIGIELELNQGIVQKNNCWPQPLVDEFCKLIENLLE